MSYPLGKLHQISFTAPMTVLRSIIDVGSTEEVEVGCHANPEHVPMHTMYMLVYALQVYTPTIPFLSCYLTWSSLFFTFMLQRCMLLSLNKALCRLFLESNADKSIWGQDSYSREGIKNINTSILNLTLKLKSFNQIKHVSRSCPWAWKWPSSHLKEN